MICAHQGQVKQVGISEISPRLSYHDGETIYEGQAVLFEAIRRRMNLRPGDQIDTRIERGRATAEGSSHCFADVEAGKNAPILTSEEVAEDSC